MPRWTRAYTWGVIDVTGRTYLFNMQEREAKRVAQENPEFIAVTVSQKQHPKRELYGKRHTTT